MRQIKFKVWDTVLKRWNYSIEIDCYGRLQEYKWNGSAFYAKYKNDYEENYEDVSNRFIICQFTGLLDKNGKEVYEGDVVECWGGEQAQGFYEISIKGVVEYSYNAFLIKDSKNCFYDFSKFDCNLKIIGNIYENPNFIP